MPWTNGNLLAAARQGSLAIIQGGLDCAQFSAHGDDTAESIEIENGLYAIPEAYLNIVLQRCQILIDTKIRVLLTFIRPYRLIHLLCGKNRFNLDRGSEGFHDCRSSQNQYLQFCYALDGWATLAASGISIYLQNTLIGLEVNCLDSSSSFCSMSQSFCLYIGKWCQAELWTPCCSAKGCRCQVAVFLRIIGNS